MSSIKIKKFKRGIVITYLRNHLAILKTYAVSDTPKEIENYLDRLLGMIENGDLHSDTGNIAIDSIINYKLLNVKKDEVKLDINLLIPTDISIDATDIVTIFANLLDNALETVEKVNDKIISKTKKHHHEIACNLLTIVLK